MTIEHRPAGAFVTCALYPRGRYLPADQVFKLLWRLRGVTEVR